MDLHATPHLQTQKAAPKTSHPNRSPPKLI
jgi:hypothetical protein